MGAHAERAVVGVDIGGTFTDIVLSAPGGRLLIEKVSSTPGDPAQAVLDGLARMLRRSGIAAAAIAEVVHGTTVASNCILEKKGARTALLTTKGFRDVLEIGRIRTPTMFDLDWDKPQPLVARRHRLEVNERIGADGSVVRPLDEAGVEAAAAAIRRAGIESVAVCFINSYRNPEHELRAEAILERLCSGVNVTASFRVLPELKEYERTSTTVVNAYIQPSMRRYIGHLSEGLRGLGVTAPLLVVASNGGIMSAEAMRQRPVFAVGSGPAAGVAGTARLGRAAGMADLIAFDMGGTTAKASLVEGGEPSLTSEYEFREGISTPSRFIKAGGYMLKVPAIDIAEVGSGAGSIAWIDAGGLLNVGPHSAGADPGPACYGLGGERPTVTDANVVLGYLNPEFLAGGSLRLHREKAEVALTRHVAAPLGLSLAEAAYGVRRVVNANMARAVRSVTIERGRDPRSFVLVAFGGSGPVHAVDIARALGVRRVLVPILPGVFTAVGMLASDVEHHFVRSAVTALDTADFDAIGRLLDELRGEGEAALADEGYEPDARALRFAADLRFLGQGSELTVPLADGALSPAGLPALRRAFFDEYARTYGHALEEPIELVNLRLAAAGLRAERLRFEDVQVAGADTKAGSSRRKVYFAPETGYVDVPVHDRGGLGGGTLEGPAIIESYDSTIMVGTGCRARVDSVGNVVIDIG